MSVKITALNIENVKRVLRCGLQVKENEMAVSYKINHVLTVMDGVPWLDEVGDEPQAPHNWAHTLPDGNTVWGRVLRAVRVGTGTTQEQLANRLGVGVRTIRNWETGRTVPSERKARIYWKQISKTK